MRLAVSITSFLITLKGNGEESNSETLNYPALRPSLAFLLTFFFHIPLVFLQFVSHLCLSLHSFLFFCLWLYFASQTFGLWGVTLQESGCNNMAVICLDLIWSQTSWESRRGMWGLLDKEKQRGERERQTEDNKRDRGEPVWEAKSILGAPTGPRGCASVFCLDLLGLPARTFSSCKPADLLCLNKAAHWAGKKKDQPFLYLFTAKWRNAVTIGTGSTYHCFLVCFIHFKAPLTPQVRGQVRYIYILNALIFFMPLKKHIG